MRRMGVWLVQQFATIEGCKLCAFSDEKKRRVNRRIRLWSEGEGTGVVGEREYVCEKE